MSQTTKRSPEEARDIAFHWRYDYQTKSDGRVRVWAMDHEAVTECTADDFRDAWDEAQRKFAVWLQDNEVKAPARHSK